MKSSLRQFKRAGLACVALGSIAATQQAYAVGTAAETNIDNQATVSYTVSGVAQTPIESSPTGNSTPGGGAVTRFVVDNRVNLLVSNAGPASVQPGQTGQAVAFRVDNLGNDTQGYSFLATDPGGDTFDVTGAVVRVSPAACNTASMAAPVYVPADPVVTVVNSLGDDECRWVFIVADVPLAATNGQLSNVRLRATTTAENDTGNALTEDNGVDDALAVDVVFGDSGENGFEEAINVYNISTAALEIRKQSEVVEDPFNGTTNPKAIPGAFVEYSIRLNNTGAANATVVTITDPVPANTTFRTGSYNGAASDVWINVTGVDTFCVAETGGLDTNTDGCVLTGGNSLSVGAPALATVATGGLANAVTVRFQVVINN